MSAFLIVLATQAVAGDLPRPPLVLTVTPRNGCDGGPATDVVVCGERRGRYRLPLPVERDAGAVERPRGEAPSALAAITPGGRCGLFAGERRCGKAEAAHYGYGEGRDPITMLSRLGRRLVSPDSEP